jgi:hypothetical protein
MSSDSSIRASDQDRDRTADLLREHHAVGRLTAEEFAERLDKSFNAKTIGELEELTTDLPAIDLYPLPTASLPRHRTVSSDLPAASVFSQAGFEVRIWHGSGRFSPGWLAAWGSWSVILAVCFVAWAISGTPWPLLVVGGFGAIMGVRWAAGPRGLGAGGGHRGQIGTSLPDEIGPSDEDH